MKAIYYRRNVYFFGCLDRSGHFLYEPPGRAVDLRHPFEHCIDSGLIPNPGGVRTQRDSRPDGQYHVAFTRDWTAVAFWDRSGDCRPMSNSVFLINEEVKGEELLALARIQWPQIFRRVGFPILRKAIS